MITGIVVALPEELSTLTSKRIDKGQCVFLGDNLLVACSGIGARNAQAAAEQLISRGADRLISWGCAAGLSASVQPGDLIVADHLIDAENNEIAVDPQWRHYSIQLLKQQSIGNLVIVRDGSISESNGLMAGSRDKMQRHARTGAVALDMESVAIAKVAGRHKLEFLAIRAIADPVSMSLPKAIAYSFNDQGQILIAQLLLHLILHPLELPGLIRLALHFNKAKSTLKAAASRLDSIARFSVLPELETH